MHRRRVRRPDRGYVSLDDEVKNLGVGILVRVDTVVVMTVVDPWVRLET